MIFQEALEHLLDGKFVRRKDWSKNYFITMPYPQSRSRKLALQRRSQIFGLCGDIAPALHVWKPRGVDDFFADDWEIVTFTVLTLEAAWEPHLEIERKWGALSPTEAWD